MIERRWSVDLASVNRVRVRRVALRLEYVQPCASYVAVVLREVAAIEKIADPEFASDRASIRSTYNLAYTRGRTQNRESAARTRAPRTPSIRSVTRISARAAVGGGGMTARVRVRRP